MCADVGDLTDAAAAGELPGPVDVGTSVVHVSVGGYHRFVEGPRTLSPAEEEGWVRAVYGPQSEDAAYYGGHSTEITPTGIAHFFLFLGPDRTPVPAPHGWAVGPLRPITRPAPQLGRLDPVTCPVDASGLSTVRRAGTHRRRSGS